MSKQTARAGIVVAGGASTIGAAVATRLVDRGWSVVLADADADALEQALTAGDRVVHLVGELSDSATGRAAVDTTVDRFGAVDAIVNVLETTGSRSIGDLTDEAWISLLDRNVRSLYAMTQPVVETFSERPGGRVVLLGSRSWLGEGSRSAVSATAGAVTGFIRALALEIGRFNATANALSLSYIDTPEWRHDDPVQAEMASKATAVRRAGLPDEVAGVVEFLLSGEADFITGQILAVCGGSSIGKSVF